MGKDWTRWRIGNDWTRERVRIGRTEQGKDGTKVIIILVE